MSPVKDFAALGERWRDLEARSDCSFFQSWTWVGCLAEERYPDAVLAEASDRGRTVALALFNRGRGRLFLHESGIPALDCPYIEQNGVLAERGRAPELNRAVIGAAARHARVTVSGAQDAAAAGLRGRGRLVLCRRQQASPYVDLGAIRRSGTDYLAGRSANTREQIRRSDKHYGRNGPIAVTRPQTLPEALAMLESLAGLHQAAWTARGKPGSFAEPFFRRFHRALIKRAWPRQEATLMAVESHGAVIGNLYNFTFRRHVLAYQSGFAYAPAERAAKPGLTCHHAAIKLALAEDYDVYDFLAGNDRYKRSLANASYQQAWLETGPFWSPGLLVRCAAARLSALRPAPRTE